MSQEWKRTILVLTWLLLVMAMAGRATIIEQMCWLVAMSLVMSVVGLMRG